MANYVFPLITIPIVARIFGPEKLGLINYIAAIVGYFSLVVSYSFNFTGVRRVTREKTVVIRYSQQYLPRRCY